MVRTSELRVKEVVNVVDGRRLGLIGDLELNLEAGRIEALVIPGSRGLLGFFGRERDLVIPWRHVRKIGVDVILVDLDEFGLPRQGLMG